MFNTNQVELPNYPTNINNYLKFLQDNFYTEEDVKRRVYYLHNEFYKFNKVSIKEKLFGYKLLSKEQLDILYNECAKYILKEYEKIKK